MQPNTEQLMTKQDIIAIAEQLDRIEQQNAAIEAMLKSQQSIPKKLVLTCAKDVADCLGVSEWQARDIMRQPDFPKSIKKRNGKYNRGKWRTEDVENYVRVKGITRKAIPVY